MLSDKPDYEIQSTIKGHRVEMSIDMDSLADLFDVLSGLYTDAEMAVLRELSTNARDSHIEAGVTRPIEITLPNPYGESDLIIQDFGVGMSRRDIEETYSKYGASTKRDSNDYNGTLGLGSKSPLTYTPQFTFIGIKDGIKTTVSVSKGESVPVMTLLSEIETDEGNGVRIIIPARVYNNFEKKAAKLFRFWPAGTVLVGGEEPERLVPTLKITDKIWITDEVGSDIIVMAGVPYPTKFDHSLVHGHRIVAFVETGEVSFAPSREGLKDNSKTVNKIAAILAEYERGLNSAISNDLDQAPTACEAFKKLHEWRNALGVKVVERTAYKYKGQEIPTEFTPDGENEKITVSEVDSSVLSAHSRYPAVAIEVVAKGLVVHGYEMANFTPNHKKKLIKYVEDNDIEGVDHFVLLKDKLPMQWLDSERVVDWEIIREIKLPIKSREYSTSSRIPGSYDIYEQGDFNEGIPADDIDQTASIYYCMSKESDATYNRILKRNKKAYTLVVLTVNRVEKFKRLFPNAENVSSELVLIHEQLCKSVTQEQRVATAIQKNHLARCLKRINVSRIDDPDFSDVERLMNMDLSDTALGKLNDFKGLSLPGLSSKIPDPINPFDRYPLFRPDVFYYRFEDDILEHTYLYMNAAYAAHLEAEANKEQ